MDPISHELRQRFEAQSPSSATRQFWSEFEQSNKHRPEFILQLLESLDERGASLSDFYTVARYSGSNSVPYNIRCLDFARTNLSSTNLESLNSQSFKPMYESIVYMEYGAKLSLARSSDGALLLPKVTRWIAKGFQCFVTNDEFLVIGSKEFISPVLTALDLLKRLTPDVYQALTNLIGMFQQWHTDGIAVDRIPPSYLITLQTVYQSPTWLASCIAHEMEHCRLFNERAVQLPGMAVPHEAYGGDENELKCIAYQIAVAERLGSPESEITHLRAQDGTHWRKAEAS